MITKENNEPNKSSRDIDRRKTNKQTWPLRPSDELRELVDLAVKATGKARQKIIFACIEKALSAVLEEFRSEQQLAEKRLSELRRKIAKR